MFSLVSHSLIWSCFKDRVCKLSHAQLATGVPLKHYLPPRHGPQSSHINHTHGVCPTSIMISCSCLLTTDDRVTRVNAALLLCKRLMVRGGCPAGASLILLAHHHPEYKARVCSLRLGVDLSCQTDALALCLPERDTEVSDSVERGPVPTNKTGMAHPSSKFSAGNHACC